MSEGSKGSRFSKLTQRIAHEWGFTEREADYFAKKLAKMREKLRGDELARLQEYADLYACLLNDVPAKSALVQSWQADLSGRVADDALASVTSLERVMLSNLLFDTVETLAVNSSAPLGAVRSRCEQAYTIVKFFKRVRRAIEVQRYTTKKLGRYEE